MLLSLIQQLSVDLGDKTEVLAYLLMNISLLVLILLGQLKGIFKCVILG